jgi:hypothetical protein
MQEAILVAAVGWQQGVGDNIQRACKTPSYLT